LPAATGAYPQWPRPGRVRLGLTGFSENPATPVAFQEKFSSFDRDEGNKKKTQVMIQAFEPSEGQSTIRAGPLLVIYLNLLGLQTPDEDESAPPLEPG